MNLDHPDGNASFLQSQPGGIIRVVIKTSHHDLISGIEFTANRPAHGKGERGHVRTEHDFFRIAGKKFAMALRAPASIASVRWLVANAPSVLALLRRK